MSNITDPDQEQIMVDIETLGTVYNSVMVSLGAVKFSIAKGIIDTFEINIDPMDSRKLGLVIQSDTINWWKTQPKEISALWRVNPQPLKHAMSEFVKWYGNDSLPFWCRGLNFDEPIIRSNLMAVGMVTPWKYHDVNDLRTVGKLLGVKAENTLDAHGALNDAINQYNHLLGMLRS